jgi:hypothetical protein
LNIKGGSIEEKPITKLTALNLEQNTNALGDVAQKKMRKRL